MKHARLFQFSLGEILLLLVSVALACGTLQFETAEFGRDLLFAGLALVCFGSLILPKKSRRDLWLGLAGTLPLLGIAILLFTRPWALLTVLGMAEAVSLLAVWLLQDKVTAT